MKILSIDIAATSGFALWEDGRLVYAGVIRRMPRTKRLMEIAVHYPGTQLERPQDIYDGLTERAAWQFLIGDDPYNGPDHLVIEAAHVRFPKPALKLGEHHGRVIAHLGFESYTQITKPTVGEWRAACHSIGANWPKKKKGAKSTAAFKAESVRLAKVNWGIDAGDNAADAIGVGHWWNVTHAPYPLPLSYPGRRSKRG